MIASSRPILQSASRSHLSKVSQSTRHMTSQFRAAKKEGDISSVFVSLSGASTAPLPESFATLKRNLISGNEQCVRASWGRLLERLAIENEIVSRHGTAVIPQVHFKDLNNLSDEFRIEVKERGVAVVKGVVPEAEARAYKIGVEKYIKANPSTKAFPPQSPAVYELYWSPSQVQARAHPNMISTQRSLMNIWHSSNKNALISMSRPLTYADRVRIRQPGDAGFALGPHVDGGSLERWEPEGYGLGGVYQKVFEGEWEQYDPWEASSRVSVVSDLYDGAGACSMFRMFQGWLGLSHTGPNEGTLKVNPLLQLSTAYFLLRPYFVPINQPSSLKDGKSSAEFLHVDNWRMKTGNEITSELQGANPGHAQELNQVLHPHLDLGRTMVHIPKISPGDYVVWHCDTIHAVDAIHQGISDSSVLYIPVCPTTETNAEYLVRQRDTFLGGFPGPDFPGGMGESEHFGRPTVDFLSKQVQNEALQAMGLERLYDVEGEEESIGARRAVQRANEILGF